MPEPTVLGRRLKRFREEAGLSQKRLSELSGVPRATIGSVEAGVQDNVSLPSAIRLADALGITIDVLVRGDPLQEDDPVAASV